MENKFMRVEEVAEVLEVSTSFAYKVIRQLNDELKAKAYSTFASLLKGWNVGASKRKLGSRVKLNAFSGW